MIQIDEDVRAAFRAFYKLTTKQRAEVMCWFCDACFEYIGPGATHTCSEKDGE